MADASNNPIPERGNGHAGSGVDQWPRIPYPGSDDGPPRLQTHQQLEREIPRLHEPGATPLVRDRWERLVTAIQVPTSPEEVWHALTDPDCLKKWLAVCHGSLEQPGRDCVLDFEDGEFFLCRPTVVDAPNHLKYYWRWLGIGQATSVSWQIDGADNGTRIVVTEEAMNPPWDWQTWNGGGWPGILEQLAAYLRTGIEWRWPWRRMGPYAQVELPVPIYEAWDRLFSPHALKYWLLSTSGFIAPGQVLPVILGDASGMVEMYIREVVEPGQSAPSFLPHIGFSLKRSVWNTEVGGRLWVEPSGWGKSLFQVFHYNWENLPPGIQLSERKIFSSFWAGAMRRASQMCAYAATATSPHNWS